MSQIIFKFKDDLQAVLLLSCFVGHPVCTYKIRVVIKIRRISIVCEIYQIFESIKALLNI